MMRPQGGYANQGGAAPNDSWTFNPGAQEFVPRGPQGGSGASSTGNAGPGGAGGKGSPAAGTSSAAAPPIRPGPMGVPMTGPMNPAMPPGPMPQMGPPGPMGAPMGAPMGQRPPMGQYPPMTGHYPGPWPQPVPGMHGHGMPPWMPPGMAMGPHDWNAGRGPMTPYPGTHHMTGSTQGMGNQMSSNGLSSSAAHPTPIAPVEPPHVFVAIWNLDPGVKDPEMKEELEEVDFLPDDDKVVKFKNTPGAWLCGFREEYFANAFAISFNNSTDYLRSNGNPIKAAKWTKDAEWGKYKEVPSLIQDEFPALRDELAK